MIKKNDFIEIEFTARTLEGDIFDTNIKEDAQKINLKIEPKPLIICISQNMILPSIDEFLTGKSIGEYQLELSPEKAFGFRKRELVKTMPLSVFRNSQNPPYPGAVFSFDNMLGKVTSVSGGRVIVDFNNPVAGKSVVYDLKVKKIIDNQEEKIKSLFSVFFGSEIPFKVQENRIIIEADRKFKQLFQAFSPKFKEILNLDLEVKEKPEKEANEQKEEKK